MIRIKGEYVNLIDRFKSDEDSMEAIACIHIRPTQKRGCGVLIEAFNGHSYGVFNDADGLCEREIVLKPSKALLKACAKPKKAPKRGEYVPEPLLVIIDELVQIEKPFPAKPGAMQDDFRVSSVHVEDQYGRVLYIEPNPDDCIKRYQFPNTDGFLAKRKDAYSNKMPMSDVKLPISQFAMFDFGTTETQRCLTLYGTGKESPIFVHLDAYPEFIGIFMPMMVQEEVYYGEVKDAVAAGFFRHPLDKPWLELPAPFERYTDEFFGLYFVPFEKAA